MNTSARPPVEPTPSAPGPSAPPGPPTLASRLGDVHVDLRSDLEVSRHVFRQAPTYILRDPMTFQSHRMDVREYGITAVLSASRSLKETFAALTEQGVLKPVDEESFYQFVISLHKLNFLHLPISDDAALYQRAVQKQQAKRKQMLMALFFFQIPLCNPDAFLERTIRHVRFLFTRGFFIAWLLLVGLAGHLVAHNFADFTAPLADAFSMGNLPLMWATLLILKLAHELGHAYACKHFGGTVPEGGVYVIVGAPCAYVDASACWGFPRKLHRLIVCMAGMYVEVSIGAVAVIVWSVTDPGLLNSAMHNVVLLSTVVTVAFNVNPLMRFDGYYAFSDLIEVPNLRARATAFASQFVARRFVGGKPGAAPGSRRMQAFLLSFGAASAVYKITVVMGISTVIAMKYAFAGVFLGTAYISMELYRVLGRSIRFLWQARGSLRWRVRFALAAAVVLLPMALFLVPIPDRITVPATLTTEGERVLRASASGFLREVLVRAGDPVAEDASLVELVDPEVERRLLRADAQLEEAALRLRGARQAAASVVLEQQARFDASRKFQQLAEDDRRSLSVRSPAAGRVVQALGRRDLGRFVREGEAVATVATGRLEVRAYFTSTQLAASRPRVGQEVAFRSMADADRTFRGVIDRITPVASRRLEPRSLSQLGSGDIPVHPATGETDQPYVEVSIHLESLGGGAACTGMTGRVLLDAGRETLARTMHRKALVFWNRLRGKQVSVAP